MYPNRYGLGMANLGLHAVLATVAGHPAWSCHRAFADQQGTVESGEPLDRYPVVAFTLSYEGDYPAALTLLARDGISLRTADRGETDPLVVAGGVAPTLNPEPLAPFVDAFFLGEAEAGLARVLSFLAAHRTRSRPDLLATLADAALPGVYVPSRYRVTEDTAGIPVHREALGAAPPGVARVWAPVPWDPARSRIHTPETAFGGAFLLEVSRGCPHGCRFCAAGHATRPARFLPRSHLEPLAREGVQAAGRVGLVGAAVSDHPGFEALAETILGAGGRFTVSSFRVENLDRNRLDLLVRGGLRTLTVAVEAGSGRLRRRLGKELDDESVLAAARLAGEAGVRNLRLYAMVGVPGETPAEVEALAKLAGRVREALGGGTVTLSAAPFVPKAHTPLQWEAMASEADLRSRIRLLARRCGPQKGVRMVAEAPKWSRVQGLLARGGRSVGPLLEEAARTGNWRDPLRSPLASRILDRERDPEEPLPWQFVAGGPSYRHLVEERAAAERGDAPVPCHSGACRICGVCATASPDKPSRDPDVEPKREARPPFPS